MKREYKPISKTRVDLTGQVFDRLTVVSLLGTYKNQHYWMCSCTCGGTAEVSTRSLRGANTRSCGCLISEGVIARSTTHGQSHTAVYGMWRRMIQRCEDQNCADYKYYGARGITVCKEWHDFERFLADVGDRPEGMTLERVRNDEGYGPTNFMWATRLDQMQNTRQSRLITYNGQTKTLSMWAREFGIEPRTFHARLNKLGYTFDDAISKEVKPGAMLNGKTWRENQKGDNDDNYIDAA